MPKNTKPLSPQDILYVHGVVRRLLFYARVVDITTLVALNTIEEYQYNGTTDTMNSFTWILDYCTTYPDARLRYKSNEMRLKFHSNASYLSV